MESYTPPVGPRDPYDRYRVEELQQDRRGSFGGGPEDPDKQKPSLLLYVLFLLRKLFQLFEIPLQRKIPSSSRIHLLLLRGELETLKKENKSQDTLFLHRMADIWRKLLDDQQNAPALSPFLGKIQSYPEGQQHTLGYYLSEYVGEKWLPFPFMELVSKLHFEHTHNPINSTLYHWILQIDSLLPLLV